MQYQPGATSRAKGLLDPHTIDDFTADDQSYKSAEILAGKSALVASTCSSNGRAIAILIGELRQPCLSVRTTHAANCLVLWDADVTLRYKPAGKEDAVHVEDAIN